MRGIARIQVALRPVLQTEGRRWLHPPAPGTAAGKAVTTIVRSMDKHAKDTTRTVAVLCDNEAGVLSRVAGTLSSRGFNIHSLTVSPTHLSDLSRMTIVMKDVPDNKMVQAIKQLSDIVNVWAVLDYSNTNSLTRELVMLKVSYMPSGAIGQRLDMEAEYNHILRSQGHRSAVRDIATLFGAEVVDVGSTHITYQLTSWSRRIDAFIRMMQPFGIIEVARSGVIAMQRSSVGGVEDQPLVMPQERLAPQRAATPEDTVTDPTALPPG